MRPCRGSRGGGYRSALASEEAPTAEALGAEAAIQPRGEGDEALDEGELAAALGAQAGADAGAPADAGVSPVAVSYSGLSAPIVRAEVALASDGRPEAVVGSFAEGGMAFAVQPDGTAMLVAVAPGAWSEGIEAAAGSAPEGAPGPAAEAAGAALAGAEGAASGADAPSPLAIPASVEHAGCAYEVAAIGAHALSLCEAATVAIPASVASIDEDALWPTSVQRVEVDAANPAYASFDGILCDASLTRLLSIPGGREGAVRIPDKMEVVDASVFSHCAGVDAISVDAGGAAFSSWDGLLYDASGATLLRVPAGATDVTIRDGCTSVAAGALEGCTALERIEAPASVSSISPDAFASVPTVELPSAALLDGPSQLSGLVALSSSSGDLPQADPSRIAVELAEGADAAPWEALGFLASAPADAGSPLDGVASAAVFGAGASASDPVMGGNTIKLYGNGGTIVDGAHVRGGYGAWGADGFSYQLAFNNGTYTWTDRVGSTWTDAALRDGYEFAYWSVSLDAPHAISLPCYIRSNPGYNYDTYIYAVWKINVTWDPNGGKWGDGSAAAKVNSTVMKQTLGGYGGSEVPTRPGCRFAGWSTSASASSGARQVVTPNEHVTYYAIWQPYAIDFDVDSQPTDEGYAGEEMGPIEGDAASDDGTIAIEDPKRPGYVFQGWVIPNAGGTEAIDQDLVYQGGDGKWYVDASKLPDYAGDDGRVELTARWTSVISVDVPSRVTFLADVVTQGQASRDGLVQGAFAQAKAVNRSEVDLRIVGLEATAVGSGDGALGADAVLKQAADATPASSAQKLLSVYPSDELPTSDELKDPTRVSALPEGAVGFDLGDTLLEAAFDPEAFAIPAGGQLSLGYRLNLAETATELDYDALSSLDPGQSAQIATVSYTFSADPTPAAWDEPFWVKNEDPALGRVGYYLLDDIKAAAEDLAAHASDPTQSEYYALYHGLLERQAMGDGQLGAGPYFQLRLGGAYVPVQLIGICQDARAYGGGSAGLTFAFATLWQATNANSDNTGVGGWRDSQMRALLQGTGAYAGSSLADQVDSRLRAAVTPVLKRQQLCSSDGGGLQATSDTFFIPSCFEVFGTNVDVAWNGSEDPSLCFQYEAFAAGGATYGPIDDRKRLLDGTPTYWWTRTACTNNRGFGGVSHTGSYAFMGGAPTITVALLPCFAL